MSKFQDKANSFNENKKDITGPPKPGKLDKFKKNGGDITGPGKQKPGKLDEFKKEGKEITQPKKPEVTKKPPDKTTPALKPKGPKK